ncbi:flagellar assembly protein FliH [Paracoccaceae bacterium]|nr:flagellar assembly protein FliH [Paracoccaceae bacterium]
MEPLEEKDSSPLEDTEITRLIKVSRELGYKKQDIIPERNLVDFKPTSITQIATSSDHRVKEPIDDQKSAVSTKPVQNENLNEHKTGPSQDLSDSVLNTDKVDTEANSKSTGQQEEISNSSDNPSTAGSETLKNLPISEALVGKDTPKEKGSEHDSVQEMPAGQDIVKEPRNISDQNETSSMEEAKQVGIEIGKKIALAEFESKQQEVLETFQVIVENIKKKELVDKTNLIQSIVRSITRLASERAGSAIDENPDAFRNKIVSFADKIEQESKNLILNLNPQDASLLKKNLAKSLSDKEVEIRENSELFRGDFIFQMGTVEIGDLISEQILIEEKESVATIKKNEPEIDNLNSAQKEVGSDNREEIQKPGNEKISEIDNEGK